MKIGSMTRVAALSALGALGACSLMPQQRAEAPILPKAWEEAPVAAAPATLDWWKGFNDPLLDRLVAEGLQSGPSIETAALRLKEARAQSRQTFSRYLPEVNADGVISYTRALDGPKLTGSFQSFAQGGQLTQENIQATGTYGPAVAWEIPLFSRIEAAAIGAKANTRVAESDFRAAQVALVADTAQAYVDLRANQQRLVALREAAGIAQQLATILESSANAGIAAPADFADAQRLAAATRVLLPDAVIAARQSATTLAILRGKAPGADSDEITQALAAPGGVPSIALASAPAAPADLLRMRPDLAEAEAQTLLAAANVGVARSDLLPQLRLTGSIDVTDNLIGSQAPERLIQGSLLPTITMPLFDWGKRAAAVDVSLARFQQSLVAYRATVATAIGEASTALTALTQGSERLDDARKAEEAAERYARGIRASYGAGIASLSDRLRAEQQLIDARSSRIAAERSQASAAIQVYRAFGGGPSGVTKI